MTLRWQTETISDCNCGPCQPGLCGPGLITRGFLANTIGTRGLVAQVVERVTKIVDRLGRSGRRQLQRIAVAATLVSVNTDSRDWELQGQDARIFEIEQLKFPPKVTIRHIGTTIRKIFREIVVAARRIVKTSEDDDPDIRGDDVA